MFAADTYWKSLSLSAFSSPSQMCLNRQCQNVSVFGVHACSGKCHGRGVSTVGTCRNDNFAASLADRHTTDKQQGSSLQSFLWTDPHSWNLFFWKMYFLMTARSAFTAGLITAENVMQGEILGWPKLERGAKGTILRTQNSPDPSSPLS